MSDNQFSTDDIEVCIWTGDDLAAYSLAEAVARGNLVLRTPDGKLTPIVFAQYYKSNQLYCVTDDGKAYDESGNPVHSWSETKPSPAKIIPFPKLDT